MAKVKVFCHRVTDRTKTRWPRIPLLGHKKLVFGNLDKMMDRQTDDQITRCVEKSKET